MSLGSHQGFTSSLELFATSYGWTY